MSTLVRDNWQPFLCGVAAAVATGWVARRISYDDHRPKPDSPQCMSSADFMAWGLSLLQWIVRYRKDCRDEPCRSVVKPNYLREALPPEAPEEGQPWQEIMSDLDTIIAPGLTHWEASNKFFAYFKPHSSYPAVLGELLHS